MSINPKPTRVRTPEEAGIVMPVKYHAIFARIDGELGEPLRLYCAVNKISVKKIVEDNIKSITDEFKKTHAHLFDNPG